MASPTCLKCQEDGCDTTVIGFGAQKVKKVMAFHTQLQIHRGHLDENSPAAPGAASLPCIKCLEDGCELMIIGVNAGRLMESHADAEHRISFEETSMGKLPNEIKIKIIGYLVPDCKVCFHHNWDILKLGSVCKGLNLLIKAEGWYRSILPEESSGCYWLMPNEKSCSPRQTLPKLKEIITNTDYCYLMKQMLQTIICPRVNAEEWYLLDYAMLKGGHAIENIRLLDSLSPESIHGKIGQLKRLSKYRLPALRCLDFAPDFKFSLAESKNGEAFFDRVDTLTIHLKELASNEQTTRIVRTAAIALRKIPSLKKFIVMYKEGPWVAMTNNIEVCIENFEIYLSAELGRIKWIIENDECRIDEHSVCTIVMKREEGTEMEE